MIEFFFFFDLTFACEANKKRNEWMLIKFSTIFKMVLQNGHAVSFHEMRLKGLKTLISVKLLSKQQQKCLSITKGILLFNN